MPQDRDKKKNGFVGRPWRGKKLRLGLSSTFGVNANRLFLWGIAQIRRNRGVLQICVSR